VQSHDWQSSQLRSQGEEQVLAHRSGQTPDDRIGQALAG
jgi:hypothetical protein